MPSMAVFRIRCELSFLLSIQPRFGIIAAEQEMSTGGKIIDSVFRMNEIIFILDHPIESGGDFLVCHHPAPTG